MPAQFHFRMEEELLNSTAHIVYSGVWLLIQSSWSVQMNIEMENRSE